MKHFSIPILTLALLLSACSGRTDAPQTDFVSETASAETEAPAITEISPRDEAFITWYGRNIETDGAVFFDYTAAGFTVRFRGTKLDLTFTATEWNNDTYRPYITVITDGEEYRSAPVYALDSSIKTVSLELPEGEHTVRVLKRSEAHRSRAALTKAVTDGTFLPAAARPELLIEFFGDSITCGYGNRADAAADFTTDTEDGLATFAFMAAEALGAESSMIAKSGIAVHMNKWNSTMKMADLVGLASYHTEGGYEPRRQADAAVIYLGVNDRGYIAEASSAAEKEQRFADFTRTYEDLVRDILSLYPSAKIVCCTGMYGEATEMGPHIRAAIENAAAAAGIPAGEQLYYLELPSMTAEDGRGAHGHPTVTSHERAARVLTEKLAEILER